MFDEVLELLKDTLNNAFYIHSLLNNLMNYVFLNYYSS